MKIRLFSMIAMIGFMVALTACQDIITIGPYKEEFLSKEEIDNLDYKIDLSYTFKNSSSPRLKITHSFMIPRKQFGLQLPNTFMKKTNLYEQLEDFTISGGNLYQDPNYGYVKLVTHHDPDERVYISYLVKPFSLNSSKTSFSAPIIESDFFQFVGSMAFMNLISLDVSQPFKLVLNWNLPKNFKNMNSYGVFDGRQNITTSVEKLWDNLFLGGSDIRYQRREIKGYPVHLTFKGTWDHISDNEFSNLVEKLLKTQRSTWQDYDFPTFLVSFISVNNNCSSKVKYAGTAHQDSFRAYFPRGCPMVDEMKMLVSHELVHTWIGKKISVGNERGKIDGKWFTEGFSDYYGRIMAFRAGLISTNHYYLSVAKEIKNYIRSSAKEVRLSSLINQMYKESASSRDIEKLPYQQGEMIAIKMNNRIKAQSNFKHSLDDLIKDMLVETKYAGGSKNFSFDEINEISKKYLVEGVQADIQRIIDGNIISPPKLGKCFPYGSHHKSRISRYGANYGGNLRRLGIQKHEVLPEICEKMLY